MEISNKEILFLCSGLTERNVQNVAMRSAIILKEKEGHLDGLLALSRQELVVSIDTIVEYQRRTVIKCSSSRVRASRNLSTISFCPSYSASVIKRPQPAPSTSSAANTACNDCTKEVRGSLTTWMSPIDSTPTKSALGVWAVGSPPSFVMQSISNSK